MKEQYTISEMAGFFNLSSQALRHYDKIGVLKPSSVDPTNRYRLYSHQDFRKLYLIKELKSMGLPLEKIKDYCQTKNIERLEQILRANSLDLERRIAEMTNIKRRTDDYLDKIQRTKQNYSGQFEVRRLEPRCAYHIRLNFSIDNLERYIQILYTSYTEAITQQCGHERGHIVLTIDPENIRNARYKVYNGIGFLLAQPMEDANALTIPGGLYAITHHVGVYDTLYQSYKRLHRYISENGYTVNGYATEVSITDIAFTNSPQEFVTELQIPVVKQAGI